MSEIDAILATLYHPALKAIDPGLERMERFLAALGNPERRIPPVIHVAGTNGKGSLVANLRAIFEAAGLRAHVYTSPHLMRFNERIVVAGEEIPDEALLSYLQRVQALAREIPVTFFEATTAAAFLAFADAPADVTLLEVGMGGRLDATNVIAKPLLTAITPVSIDHAEFLGDTLAKIAFEKAGIIKPGVPCVAGRQEKGALEVIRRVARERGAELFAMGEGWRVEEGAYVSQTRRIPLKPALAGAHQYDNAATAAACFDVLSSLRAERSNPGCALDCFVAGAPRNDEIIQTGIASARWPGRLQLLRENPETWLDGGHNPHGARALAAWAAQGKKLHIICGMMARKDAAAFLKPLAPYAAHFTAIPVPGGEECYPPAELAAMARAVGMQAETAPSPEAALAATPENARALICGSLYLAGYVLSLMQKE